MLIPPIPLSFPLVVHMFIYAYHQPQEWPDLPPARLRYGQLTPVWISFPLWAVYGYSIRFLLTLSAEPKGEVNKREQIRERESEGGRCKEREERKGRE